MSKMKLTPSVKTTCTANTGAEWAPASFSDFLAELAHMQSHYASLGRYAPCYRGHAQDAWRLDSTFARFVKSQILGINPTDLIKDDYRHSLEYLRLLNSLFLCKFGTLMVPSQELFRASAEKGIDPWFELMKRIQQYPQEDISTLRGTFLIDWTQDWRIAIYFANHKRSNEDVGAVYVADMTQAGPVLHQDVTVEEIIEKLYDRFMQDQHPGCPLIFHPRLQIACQRAKNQDAIYIAQMDLRRDLAEQWEGQDNARADGFNMLMRILLPKGTTQEVQEWLTKGGITDEYVYPDKIDQPKPP